MNTMAANVKSRTLVVVPSVRIWFDGTDYVLDRKYFDGMQLYARLWPGRVRCIMSVSSAPMPAFGLVSVSLDNALFDITVLEAGEPVRAEHLGDAVAVLASGDSHDHLHLSRLCRMLGVKCAYIIEYIPETRYQIAALNAANRLIAMRRALYIWRGERCRQRAFACADGIQANGIAAFNHYKSYRRAMFYFDTRVVADQCVRVEEIEQRTAQLQRSRTLRLAFSGRLARMKGADHLVPLAARLRELGVNFTLDIFGAGDQEEAMRAAIARLDLDAHVTLHGVVDFEKALLPALKSRIDLFVMLHRQSDPSCTYLETLACGVPIVGYDNRAFAGLLELADVGWSAPMNDVRAVADIIVRLSGDFGEIRRKSLSGAHFARGHGFEAEFRRRIDHLLEMVDAGGDRRTDRAIGAQGDGITAG